MNEQQAIQLELTVAEVNVVLRCLGKHPFEEIAALINKIKQQGEAQLAALAAAEQAAGNAAAEPAAEASE